MVGLNKRSVLSTAGATKSGMTIDGAQRVANRPSSAEARSWHVIVGIEEKVVCTTRSGGFCRQTNRAGEEGRAGSTQVCRADVCGPVRGSLFSPGTPVDQTGLAWLGVADGPRWSHPGRRGRDCPCPFPLRARACRLLLAVVCLTQFVVPAKAWCHAAGDTQLGCSPAYVLLTCAAVPCPLVCVPRWPKRARDR